MVYHKNIKGGGKSKLAKPSQAQLAYVALLSTADKLKALFEALCAPFDITGQQYNVLRILRGAEPEGLPTLTIAHRMIESTPGITRMIDRLESKGLVEREIRSHDRRCVFCRITPKGLNLLKALDDPCEESMQGLSGLSAAELNAPLCWVNARKHTNQNRREKNDRNPPHSGRSRAAFETTLAQKASFADRDKVGGAGAEYYIDLRDYPMRSTTPR